MATNPRLSRLQRLARQAFRNTSLGKLLIDTHKEVTLGKASVRSLMSRGSKIRKLTGAEATRDLMREMGLGNAWAMIERYAGSEAWKNIVGELGSVGRMLKSLSEGKTTDKPIGISEETAGTLEVAANLLKAFGYGVTAPGGAFSVAPQHAPEHAPEFAELTPEVQAQIEEQERRQERVMQRLKGLPNWPAAANIKADIVPARQQDHPVNMQTEMIPVQSSNVHSIGFRYENSDIGTLLVRYLAVDTNGRRGGPGSLYEYFNVPSALFERFKQAGSKGAFVWDNLRIRGTVSGHKFQYDLVGITQGYVPRRAQLIYFRGPRGGLRATEAFVQRTFNLGEIRKGKLQFRPVRSQLPEQRIGKSYRIRKG